MASTEQTTKVELLAWLDAKRRHVAQQFEALAPEDRRRSHVASGWTPRGLLHHLATDVERVWLRAVMAGEDVSLPSGYDGWVAAEDESDEQVLAAYVEEARLATRAVQGLGLDSRPVWWFPGEGSPPYGSLREVLLHVLVETATHAGHLDVCCELASGAQRLVLDEPPA